MKTMKNKAFTLIELLVVIAIIGLLTSIIVISVNSARERARIAAGMKFGQNVKHSIGSELVGEWSFDNDDARDDSGNGNDGIINGPTPIDGITGRAMSFNGTSDYIDCGNTANEDYDAITIEAWIKLSSYTPSGWRTPLHRNDNTIVGSSVFFIGLESNSHQIVSTIGAGSGAGYMAGATGVIAQTATWYHIINSWDGTTAKVYVNGVEKKEYSLSSADFNNKVAVTRIGASGDGTGYLFNGVIDEVRIYSKALSSAEIQQHYAESLNKFKLAEK